MFFIFIKNDISISNPILLFKKLIINWFFTGIMLFDFFSTVNMKFCTDNVPNKGQIFEYYFHCFLLKILISNYKYIWSHFYCYYKK